MGSSTGFGGRNSGISNGRSSLWKRESEVPDGGLNDSGFCGVPFTLSE